MRVLLAVMAKELRHIRRDPWTLLLVTIGAMVLLMLLAYTFSIEVKGVPTAFWDADRSPQSRAYLDTLRNDDFFKLCYLAQSEDEASRLVTEGSAKVAVILPPGFGRKIKRGERAKLQVLVDGTAPNVAIRALGHVHALTASALYGRGRRSAPTSSAGSPSFEGLSPVEFRVRTLYNPGVKMINGFVPGLMGLVLSMPALGAAISVAREKEQGTIEQLIVTPLRRWQLLVGKLAPHLLVGLVDVGAFTLIGMLCFGVPFRGNPFHFLLLALTFLLANLALALFISTLVSSQQAATVIAFLIFVIPAIFLSGLFFPRFNMPTWLQKESYLLPVTHFVVIARGVMLKGVGLETLWRNGLFLLGFASVLMALATVRFKKRLG